MDIKVCIESCTKVYKNQTMTKVKWSKVPKDNKQLPGYHKKPLPDYLEMEKSLHEPNKRCKSKKHEKKDVKKVEKFQVSEIRKGINEVSIGWDATKGVEKRFKESQKKYAAATIDTSESSDSFLSTTHEFERLKISESYEDIQSKVIQSRNTEKERYKRNALITGIMQNKENICPVLSKVSTNDRKTVNLWNGNGILGEENNLFRDIDKNFPPLKKSMTKDSKQKNHSMSKGKKVPSTSTKNAADIPDDHFYKCKKSSKKSRKTNKVGSYGF